MSHSLVPEESERAHPSGGPLPKAVLMLGGAGVLLVIGSLLPWVTVGSVLGISGVSARWGLVSLIAGLVSAAIAVQLGTGKLMKASPAKPLAIAGVVMGAVSLGVALYVGFAIRDSVADQESDASSTSESSTGDDAFDDSMDEFEKSLEDLFKVRTGLGVYVTALGGVLAVAGGALAMRRQD